LLALERVRTYHSPLNEAAEADLSAAFSSLTDEAGGNGASLEIEGRRIEAKHAASGVVWFDFQTLCGGPRGQADYIEIARRYHTVLISGIPRMGPEQAAEARRFTWLVDEFYDRRVKLIVSAAVPPADLYNGGQNSGDFIRAASRLSEMQSKQYLAQPHLP
ncbi:MAG: cell division protein ZapE, partial [Betaproteobacteria bacterium]